MTIQYDHLRSEKAAEFDLVIFKGKLDTLTKFSDQLEFFDEYFDLWEVQKSRHIAVTSDETTHFILYCETDHCKEQGEYINLEKQKGLTVWRLKRSLPLKRQFDELQTFQQRIDFCLKYFGSGSVLNRAPGVATFIVGDIFFKNLPVTQEEWKLNNQLFYEYWDSIFSANQLGTYKDKSFTYRREKFQNRISNAIHPDIELEREIKRILSEFERIDDNVISRNSTTYFFRQRISGILLEYPDQQNDTFNYFKYLLPLIEAEHAYQYYKYLIELQRSTETPKNTVPNLQGIATAQDNRGKTSYVVPDSTLLDWLFEAFKYESSLEGRPLYELELIYYRALEYERQLWEKYEALYPVETRRDWKVFGEITKKLNEETYYENVWKLIRRLRPTVGFEAMKDKNALPAPATTTPPADTPPPTELPPLHLVPQARQSLCDALKPFVDEVSQPALSALIMEGVKPAAKIVVICQLKVFGLSFHTAKAVPDQGAQLLSTQLPNYFLRNNGPAVVELRPSVLVKHLRGN